MARSVTPGQLGRAIRARAVRKLANAGLHDVLVSQAQRRIESKGDSTHSYPDLWDHPQSYRRGGHPLLNTRNNIYNSLNGKTNLQRGGIVVMLRGSLVAVYHQHGFKTKGPNFIPLTRKANRNHSLWSREMKKVVRYRKWKTMAPRADASRKYGKMQRKAQTKADSLLTPGKDFIMAWKGVNVPQRKVFNLPPENIREFSLSILLALKHV